MIKPTIISIIETTSIIILRIFVLLIIKDIYCSVHLGNQLLIEKKFFILKLKTALGVLTLVSSHWEDLEIKCFGRTLDQNY